MARTILVVDDEPTLRETLAEALEQDRPFEIVVFANRLVGAGGELGAGRQGGVAAGVDGVFVEAHPNPPEALCDAASQVAVDQIEEFLKPLIDIHNLVKEQRD